MELFTILLSGLLLGGSPVGFIVERVGTNLISAPFSKVEQVAVRVDNAPNHQLLAGKVEKIRIATRGVWLTPELRIAALEVETDAVDVNLERVRRLQRRDLSVLDEPLQGGIRLLLTAEDLNRALSSPATTNRILAIASRFLPGDAGSQLERYEIVNPRVEFLENNRLRLQVALRDRNPTNPTDSQLAINLETGLSTSNGYQFQLVEPSVAINGTPIPSLVLNLFVDGIARQLDLRSLQARGVVARILNFQVKPEGLEIATFVSLQPSPAPTSQTKE